MADQVSDSTAEETSAKSAAAESTANVTSETAAQTADDDFDKERALATIRKLREFEKQAKTQLKELEDLRAKAKAEEEAKLSESEKLNRRLAEAEAKLAEIEGSKLALEEELVAERRAAKVARIAARLGAQDPLDANILQATATIDPNADKAEAEIEKAIATLKEKRAYLFQAAKGLAAFNPPGKTGSAETDQQRLERLYAARGQRKTPFG